MDSQNEQPLSLHALSSMRSLIINPSTPKHTVSTLLQTLTCTLQRTHPTHHTHHHHFLKLLSDLATHHPSFSQLALDLLCSHPTKSPSRLAVESLEVLTSILDPGQIALEDGLFVSLCFGPFISARLWMLRNAGLRFRVRPALLLGVFLGFTKDPYPCVREVALEGLVGLSECGVFEDVSLVKGCYHCGVQLLCDMEDCVRFSAVRMVASWGLMLAASNADMKTYWSNEVFAKLCSMARDMSMMVRVEAFNGLGKIKIISEEFLLQSLSKRVVGLGKQREILDQSTSEQFVMLATSVAGALVHGLEDEFFEVRKSVCQSLCTLTILSVDFACEALNLLTDVLNDDSVVVRLQALETMHHMAINGCLKLQEKHLHMFFGVLADSSKEVRYAQRKILKLVKLNDLVLFKLSVNGLLENLDRYPQDEADVFSAFSHLGRIHKKFVGIIMKEILEEVEAAFEGNIEFNSARMAALLILSISAPLLSADIGRIPPVMFSYAVTFLGRIYCAFSDVMDRDVLLAYLCEKSRSADYSVTNIGLGGGEQHLPLSEIDAPKFATNKVIDSESESQITQEPIKLTTYQEELQPEYNEVTNFTNYVLAKFPDMWRKIQSGLTNDVLKSLRCWKEELATMTFDSLGTGDALAFTLHYLWIFKLLAELWGRLMPVNRFCSDGKGELEFKLGKLDKRVKELMTRFVGFSVEEEINVLELMLVTCALRLCNVEICCRNFTFSRLTATYSHVESLLEKTSTLPSNFIVEIGRLLRERSSSIEGCRPLPFDKCLKLFSLQQFVFHGEIRHLKAGLNIPNIDPEHPLPFVSGLPVGIPCEITVHNILSENRLWLRMSTDDGLAQYVFLDLDRFEGSGEVRNFAFVAPFYRTAEASSLVLKICTGLESKFENVSPVQLSGGPKRELFLCTEKQVYLSKVNTG